MDDIRISHVGAFHCILLDDPFLLFLERNATLTPIRLILSRPSLGLLPRIIHLQRSIDAPEPVVHLSQRLRAAQHDELTGRGRDVNAKV